MKQYTFYLKWNMILMLLGFFLLYWIPVINFIVVIIQGTLFVMQIISQTQSKQIQVIKHD